MIYDSIAKLLPYVETAAKMAGAGQNESTFSTRRIDEDGVLTEADDKVEEFLYEKIAHLFPDANILMEGTKRPFDPSLPYTFAIDPIDGTDGFSQGMPGWCITIGLLNKELIPIAGIVVAPRFDALFFADIGKSATYNGKAIHCDQSHHEISNLTNIIVPSNIARHFDLHTFPGTVRNFGSTALQMCLPLIYQNVIVAIGNKAFMWDYAAAHAIASSLGLRFEYIDGSEINYLSLVDGSRVQDFIIIGHKQDVDQFKPYLLRL